MENLTFVLSDESLNSHGTWVRTSGIRLERFKANPVMLWSHDSDLPPIGRWDNVRVEGDKLLADAVFDESDKFAAAIKSKVEQGLLKACSIGFYAKGYSSAIEDIKPGQMYETITESELLEASICAVGSNANAVVLYDDEGEKIDLSVTGSAIGLRMLNQNNNGMNEEQVKQLQEHCNAIAEELAELKAYKAKVEEENKLRVKKEVNALVATGIASKRITQDVAEVWRKLASLDLETTKLAMEAIAPDTRLEQFLQAGKEANVFAGKSWDELDKTGRLAELKAKDFEMFKVLYRNKFGIDYKG